MGYDGTLKFDTSIDSSGFQDGISKIGSCASTALKATTAIIGGAATAVVGIGTAAIKTGSNFESSMSNVAAISGATGDELKSLTDKAKEMGAKTKFSASESADAFSYMAMAGWKTADMLDGIEGIMNLAAASGEDLATTSDIVTDALTAFGLSASDSTHFADILAKASSNANTNVGLMGETFKYVAPVAGALGFSAEDCATAIGLMANSGIKASQAGTSLRSIFTRMAKPTKEVQGAMDALGISLTNSDGSMKSLNEIMLDLRKGFSGLTREQKAQMAAALGGQEAMSGLLAIVNASDDDFNKLTDSITNCDGAAAEMADTMNDNLSGQITILKSGLEGLGISLYEEMQTPLKDIVKEAQTMAQGLQEAFNDGGLDSLVTKAGEVMAQIVTEVAEAAPKLIGTAENLVGSFIQGIVDHKSEFASAGATMVAELVRAIIDVAGDMWSAGIYLFTEFLQAMTDHSEEIGQSFGEMISKIGEAVQTNLPLIIQAAKDFVAGFCQGLSEEFPSVSALLDGFFQGFLDTAGDIIQDIVDLIGDIFSVINSQDPATMEEIGKAIGTIAASIAALKVAKDVAGSVSGLFSILKTFKGGVSGIVGVVGKAVEGFALWSGGAGTLGEVIALEFPKLAALGSTLVELVTTIAGVGSIITGAILAVTNFVDMFQNGFSVVKDILMGVGIALTAVGAVILGAPATVAAAIAGIVFAVANLVIVIKEHWDQISEFIKQIPDKVGQILDDVIAWLTEWGSNVLTWISTNVPKFVESIVKFFSELPKKVWTWLVNTFNKLVEWGSRMLQKAGEIAGNCIESIVKFFSELPGKVWNWLTNTFDKLVTWGSNTLQKAKEIGSNTINAIINFFSQLPGKIWTWLSNTLKKVIQWGSNMAEKGRSAASGLCRAVINGVANLPSQMASVGYNIVTGVWNGICNAASWFTNSVSNFFSNIVGNVKNALGIHSPSKLFADEVGEWIPPGVGQGIEDSMPDLEKQTDKEMEALADRMQAAVNVETGKITLDKNTSQTYKVEQENGQSFVESKTEVVIEGETHVHVDLDGREVGNATTPIVDENMARIDEHKRRGG